MSTIEINIDDYITEEEKKRICIDYFKATLQNIKDNERILSNMAYSAAFAIVDSVLTPEMMQTLKDMVVKQILGITDYHIFRKRDAWEKEESKGYNELQKAVEEHRHLINPLVKKAILKKDYSKDLPETADCLSECILDALRKGLCI